MFLVRSDGGKSRLQARVHARLQACLHAFTCLAVATLLMSLTPGVGSRDAYAGACTTSGGGVYACTGAAGADTTQNLGDQTSTTTVTTTAPFGINTASGNAFTLNGKNGIDFEDSNLSSIIGANNGINATNRQDGANSTLRIVTTGRLRAPPATVFLRRRLTLPTAKRTL